MDDLFDIVAARPGDHVVGWRLDQPLRNAAFLARVAAWHGLLHAAPGRNYALYLSDSIEFGAALLGAWQAGKTIWLSADTLAASCDALAQQVDGLLGEFPPDRLAMAPGAEAIAAGAAGAARAPMPALVVHTSGSTGAAQAIPKNMAQLTAEVATLEALFGPLLGDADIIATVSHQHIYGLLFKVLWPLTAGRAIHAHSQHFPEQLVLSLAVRPCALVASPAHLKRLPDHLAWEGARRCVRAVFSSGGPLAPEVAHATGVLLGQVPLEVYGSSETGGIAWRQRSAGDAWQALPGVEWRIDAEGLLEVRSPHLPDQAWLGLADRARAVEGARFMLDGRQDRIVKIEEKRISLDAIEALLTGSEWVATARLLVCAPEAGQRQHLAAFVVLTQAGRALLEEIGKAAMNGQLRALLTGAVEAVGLPRRWRYVDSLPMDAQGKTTQALLQALLEERPRLPSLRLLERTALRVVLELVVPPRLLYFDGHFSQAPVLAGVVQVDWAIAQGRRYFDLPPQFRAMHALKFQQLIVPNLAVTLELVHDEAKGSLNFRYFSPEGQHSSGRILFGHA